MKKLLLFFCFFIAYSGLSQNVGIGTTPSQKLDVNGNLKINGAFMPAGQPGTSGQILMSNGANTNPSWESTAALSNFPGRAFIRVNTNTGDVSTRNIFSNTATTSQSDSVDLISPDYNIGSHITVLAGSGLTPGIGNKIIINTAGFYQIAGILTSTIQHPSSGSFSPQVNNTLAIKKNSGGILNLELTSPQKMEVVPLNTSTVHNYTLTIPFNFYYQFNANDEFTFKTNFTNVSGMAPYNNIGQINPSYFSVILLSQ